MNDHGQTHFLLCFFNISKKLVDTLSETVSVKNKLNAIKYQEMLHVELLFFVTGIEDKKTIFQRNNAPIHTIRRYEKLVPRSRNRIITMTSIES